MLLAYGNTKVCSEWEVKETAAAGYCRLYYVYAGEVTYTDENTTAHLQNNCLYVFPSTIPYQMVQNPNKPICCTYFHMDIQPKILPHLCKIEVKKNMPLFHLLKAAAISIGQKKEGMIQLLAETLFKLLDEMGVFITPREEIYSLIGYISDHRTEKISLHDLSAKSGYNAQYLIRLFKKTIGLSPYQYILSVKMKKAAELLCGGKTVSEAAEQTGYQDIKMFSRAFKEYYKVPPSKFSRLCRVP